MPALGSNLDPRGAAFESNARRMAERLLAAPTPSFTKASMAAGVTR